MDKELGTLLLAVFDSINAYTYPFDWWDSAAKLAIVLFVWAGELIVKMLIEWIKAKNGRKIRIELRDVVIEANGRTKLDIALELLRKHGVLPNHPEDGKPPGACQTNEDSVWHGGCATACKKFDTR